MIEPGGIWIAPPNLELPSERGSITRTEDRLRADVVTATIAECLRRLDGTRRTTDRQTLTTERAQLDREIANLSNAIAAGQPHQVLLTEIDCRDARRASITMELDRLDATDALAQIDLVALESKLRAKLKDFQGLAIRHVQQARQILRLLIPGRLTMTPISTGYRFVGDGVLAPLLSGVLRTMVTPAGFEPAISTLKGSRPWPG